MTVYWIQFLDSDNNWVLRDFPNKRRAKKFGRANAELFMLWEEH